MDRIDTNGAPRFEQRARIFARAVGTRFDVRAASGGAGAEVELYDEIGMWGVTAKDFRERLNAVEGDLTLKINSPGGNVFDGIAMFNDVLGYKRKGKVRVEVTGLAASAASIVAMAGDEIAIAENGFLMIHNAWSLVIGNRHDLAETAAVLAKIDNALAKTYATRTGLGMRIVQKMMDDETWIDAEEAVERGFATEKLTAAGADAKARFDLSVFANVPAALLQDEPDWMAPETIRDAERMLTRDAGLTRSQARAVLAAARTPPSDAATRDADAELATLLRSFADQIKTITKRT